jgi:hypothetical protein
MTEFDLDAVRQVMAEDPDGSDSTGPILAAVPYGDEDDDGHEGGWLRNLYTVPPPSVEEQVAYARACEGVWEFRYQCWFAIPAITVLGLGIRIVSHHRPFFGAIAALSAVTILAALLGLL